MFEIFSVITFIAFCLTLLGLGEPFGALFWYKGERTIGRVVLFYGSTFVVAFSITFSLNNSEKPEKQNELYSDNSKINQNSTIQDVRIQDYEVLGTRHYPAVENYYVLLKMKRHSRDSIEDKLLKIRGEICNGSCNIFAYDEKKYYEYDRKMQDLIELFGLKVQTAEITPKQERSEVRKVMKKYYVDIADHLIGWLPFEGGFEYYPFQGDLDYIEFGGRHRNK